MNRMPIGEALRSLAPAPLDEAIRLRLRARVLRSTAGEVMSRRRRRWLGGASAIAASLLVAIVLFTRLPGAPAPGGRAILSCP